MKRAIAAVSILCGGLLITNPVADIVFAQNTNNTPKVEIVENIDKVNNEEVTNTQEEKPEVKEEIKETVNKEEVKKEEVVNKEEIKEEPKEEVKQEEVQKEEVEEEQPKEEIAQEENKNEEVEAPKDNVVEESQNTVEVVDVLNKYQAKELLNMKHGNANYTYEGDENTFNVLAQKGFSGYVFLPDYETDLGFFVDKNSGDIFYFHPDGYMELAV